MASTPPAEMPTPLGEPVDPGSSPPELIPPGIDTDVPDLGPAELPGGGQPSEL